MSFILRTLIKHSDIDVGDHNFIFKWKFFHRTPDEDGENDWIEGRRGYRCTMCEIEFVVGFIGQEGSGIEFNGGLLKDKYSSYYFFKNEKDCKKRVMLKACL